MTDGEPRVRETFSWLVCRCGHSWPQHFVSLLELDEEDRPTHSCGAGGLFNDGPARCGCQRFVYASGTWRNAL